MWDKLSLLHTTSLNAGNIMVGNTPARIVKIPIVGSQYMGVEAYHLTSGVSLEREPSNPHDKNAIKVCHAGRDVGYIPKDKQHYFSTEFSQDSDWESLPKAIATSSSWAIFVVIAR